MREKGIALSKRKSDGSGVAVGVPVPPKVVEGQAREGNPSEEILRHCNDLAGLMRSDEACDLGSSSRLFPHVKTH